MATSTRVKVPRAVREVEMLDAAIRVFSERGYHSASMDEIAEKAGISKPMLYAYFGSKEGLYLAAIRRSGEALMRAIADAAEPSLPPEEQMRRGTLAFFEFVGGDRDSWAVLYREASAQGGTPAAEVAGMRRRIVGLVADLLGDEAAAHALVGAGESLANWWAEHPRASAPDLADRLVSFAWGGLGAKRRRR